MRRRVAATARVAWRGSFAARMALPAPPSTAPRAPSPAPPVPGVRLRQPRRPCLTGFFLFGRGRLARGLVRLAFRAGLFLNARNLRAPSSHLRERAGDCSAGHCAPGPPLDRDSIRHRLRHLRRRQLQLEVCNARVIRQRTLELRERRCGVVDTDSAASASSKREASTEATRVKPSSASPLPGSVAAAER